MSGSSAYHAVPSYVQDAVQYCMRRLCCTVLYTPPTSAEGIKMRQPTGGPPLLRTGVWLLTKGWVRPQPTPKTARGSLPCATSVHIRYIVSPRPKAPAGAFGSMTSAERGRWGNLLRSTTGHHYHHHHHHHRRHHRRLAQTPSQQKVFPRSGTRPHLGSQKT